MSDPFVALGNRAFLQQPLDWIPTKETESFPPSTVVIFSWLNAQQQHLLKYAQGYRTLFPESRIIIVTAKMSDFSYKPEPAIKQALIPVVRLISTHPDEKITAHVFSQGGARMLWLLLHSFKERTGIDCPFGRIIFDSSPGIMHFKRTVKTLHATSPAKGPIRPVIRAVLFVMAGVFWAARELGVKDDVGELYRGLNQIVSNVQVQRRCYIYSHEDASTRWKDVEKHAAEARRQGWTTEMEVFVGSQHVQHMRADPDRYWGVVDRFLHSDKE